MKTFANNFFILHSVYSEGKLMDVHIPVADWRGQQTNAKF